MNRRTREMYAATRSEIVMSIGAAVFFAAVMAWRFASDHDPVPQVGLLAIVVWVVVSLYWFRDRIWRAEPARKTRWPRPAANTTYYRKELERRRDHLRNAWVWHGPLLLACLILLAVLTRQYFVFRGLQQVLPLVIVLLAWTGFGFVRRRRKANELQREIDEMNVV
ncbi:MAG: hypothetical protein WDO73_36740 [Ignavibacteriota bacterium]